MKLLLLLSLIALASGDEALVADGNGASPQAAALLHVQPGDQEVVGEKILGKRSYGLLPVAHVDTYAPVLPWYRFGGLSSYGLHGGWYSSWPSLYGGWHDGWHGGWYKGW